MKIAGLIIIMAVLFSCNATKQAAKHLNKALAKDSNYVAKATRDLFPCVVRGVDTVVSIDTVYDFIEVQCPDSVATITDTIQGKTIVRTIRVPVYVTAPVKALIKTNTVTVRIADSAAIRVVNKEKDLLNVKITKLEKKVKFRTTVAWILSGALLICAALVFFIIKRKT